MLHYSTLIVVAFTLYAELTLGALHFRGIVHGDTTFRQRMVDIETYADYKWPEACKTPRGSLVGKGSVHANTFMITDEACQEAKNQCQRQDCSYTPFKLHFGNENPIMPGSK